MNPATLSAAPDPTSTAPDEWWAALTHGGLLVAPSRLVEHFADPAPPLAHRTEEKLRRAVDRLALDAPAGPSADLLDLVLEEAMGLGRPHHPETGLWDKSLGPEHAHRDPTGVAIKPRRIWRNSHGAILPVFTDEAARVGVHRGRRRYAQVLEWLRAFGQPFALLTNGRQWRLVHAGLDADAWAESDTATWFQEGGEGPALLALRTLLAPDAVTPPAEDVPFRLRAAVEATRRGQSELSASLGESVRTAVERLIVEHGDALGELLAAEAPDGTGRPRSGDLYVAACRVVMRIVVLLFAEARPGLLPMDRAAYRDAYSLEGLRQALDRAAGSASKRRMRERHSAWPRLLALFRLVHDGSSHPNLPVHAYGGGLFARGTADALDPVTRAITVFETACFDPARRVMSDAAVFEVLRLLTRSEVVVRQGKRRVKRVVPVDFSDLSSEYIGILYEGLLDFELKRVDGDAPVVFLGIGDQPALALDRLELMEAKAIANLVEKLGKPTKAGASDEEEDSEEEADGEAEEEDAPDGEEASANEESETDPDEEESSDATDTDDLATEDDRRGAAAERAREWARTAVAVGKIVPKPRSKKPEALAAHDDKVGAAAKRLVQRVVLPGEWYLVRFGGTRKGSGTYYTKPELAIPTVQRTLRPLCFDAPIADDGAPDLDAPAAAWTPKRPAEILALKVCDPACGSGSFLVAALRFLTASLHRSLEHHGCIAEQGDNAIVRLADGSAAVQLEDETLPCRPDEDRFEALLSARLRRHVVERCLYGVDMDPLAVDLARVALWVETLDRHMPLTFLDHKVKGGNALVGCWFDRFRDYPALAWEREGGDEKHKGVHFETNVRGKAIKARKKRLKDELLDAVNVQRTFFEEGESDTAEQRRADLAVLLERLHAFSITEAEARERLYRDEVEPALEALRADFDAWCAQWFWPGDLATKAPPPRELADLDAEARATVRRLRERHRFFHWELEFPDVFTGPASGFAAVVGNPPWEIQKPNSKEFFSNHDPLYRAYGKQEAIERQSALFEEDRTIEEEWLDYSASFKALSNWCKHTGEPFGDPELEDWTKFSVTRSPRKNAEFHTGWRARRAGRRGFSDAAHPFRHQGSADINTYKLFLELSHGLLAAPGDGAPGGRLGMITPSGVYTDKGTGALRELFLDHCSWEWLFAFENRRKIFDIDSRFKFCPLVVQKGGRTEAVRAAFMRHDLAEWSDASKVAVPYFATQVRRFSPNSRAFLEVSDKRDLEILEKIYANSVLLGDQSEDGWGVEYRTEFHMTNDSSKFPPRPKWEAKGYEPDEYSRWLLTKWHPRTPDSPAPKDAPRHTIEPGVFLHRDGERWTTREEVRDVALPLYQGVMVQLFDPRPKAYASGAGNRAQWVNLEPGDAYLQPQFLMGGATYHGAGRAHHGFKLGFRDISNATNQRSFVSSLLPDLPVGNKVPVLGGQSPTDALRLLGCLGSLAFDWSARRRLVGTSFNWFIVEELPAFALLGSAASQTVLRLAGRLPSYDPLALSEFAHSTAREHGWNRLQAVSASERLRLRVTLDAIAFASATLSGDDVRHALKRCDRIVGETNAGSDPRGFWRTDKDRDPELRHTVLTQVAFADLQSDIDAEGGDRTRGIERFLARNDGEGWMLPETLRLADYDLGHDERAKHPQPVASRLGPRFFDWQLAQTPEESWRECEIHAANLDLTLATKE